MTTPTQYPYQQPVYPMAPRVVRPPLDGRAKRGAAIAGAVGFVLLTVGWSLVAIPIVLGVLFAVFVALFAAIAGAAGSGGDDGSRGAVRQFLDGVDVGRYVSPLLVVIVILVGLVLMAAAILISGRVLRAHAVNRPWAVTWAASGIAIVASWIVSSVGSALLQAVLVPITANYQTVDAGLWIAAGVYAVIALVVTAVIGWLSWWWMAHAMRARG